MLLNRLRNRCSWWTRACLFQFGLDQFLYRNKKDGDIILMFHNVLATTNHNLNLRNIGVADFERMLKYLRSHYLMVSLDEILHTPQKGRRIAITFDDGLVNNLHHALPVLERLQIPATVFVSTSWLAGRASLWPDELNRLLMRKKGSIQIDQRTFIRKYRNLFVEESTGERLETVLQQWEIEKIDDWLDQLAKDVDYQPAHDASNEDEWRVMKGEEIRIMSKSPWVEIGSHAVTHINLLYADDDLLKDELVESKKYIEQITGKEVQSIAFPFGGCDARVVNASLDAGYKHLIAVNVTDDYDKLKHKPVLRHGIYNDISTTESLHRINRLFT